MKAAALVLALGIVGCRPVTVPVGPNNSHECLRPTPSGSVTPVHWWAPEYAICKAHRNPDGTIYHYWSWWGPQDGPGFGDVEQQYGVQWSPNE